MGAFSLWQLLIVLLVLAVLVYPFWRILPRAGIPAPVSLVSILPLGALVLLWVLALKRWPTDERVDH